MIKQQTKFLLLFVFAFIATIITPVTFAAGDYVWEAKFKKALPKAEQGDVKSQYVVGEMYEKGKGAVRDTKQAFQWYSKAAEQGNNKATYKIGLFYYKGIAVDQNYEKARIWFSKSAENGYVRAQFFLGELYENGRGVPVDYAESLKWYKKALAGGYGSASEGINRVATAQRNSIEAAKRAEAREAREEAEAQRKLAIKESTIERVLAGGWKKRNEPVDYLPSSDTKCIKKTRNLECTSTEQTRNIGMADITSITKATLFDFKPNGEFKVTYRNNVTKIKVTDEEFAESGGKVPVTLGWQDVEHKLECELENDNTITCVRNKTRKVKLTR